MLQFIKIHCPGNIAATSISYLSERSILINWGSGSSTHSLQKSCPGGFCLGSIVWLLIANVILRELERHIFLLFAFADDFSFVFSEGRLIVLESEAARAFPLFPQLLARLHLQLSTGKSQDLSFAKPHDLQRPPMMRIDGERIKHLQKLTFLGLTIDKRKSCTEHFNNSRERFVKLYNNSCKLTAKSWGIKPQTLKFWYHFIVERIIFYCA